MRKIRFFAGKSECVGPLQAFELIRVPALGLDGPVEHADGQWHLLAATLGFSL
ncbi:hypothetical protein D3C85_751770 [compost metagenome]